MERALATYSIVAWRIMWLKYCASTQPSEPASLALEEEEWEVLYCVITKKKELPSVKPTIYEAMRWIGKLGGFLGRKGDSEPGVKTLWRGWQRLSEYATIWKMMRGSQQFLKRQLNVDYGTKKGP